MFCHILQMRIHHADNSILITSEFDPQDLLGGTGIVLDPFRGSKPSRRQDPLCNFLWIPLLHNIHRVLPDVTVDTSGLQTEILPAFDILRKGENVHFGDVVDVRHGPWSREVGGFPFAKDLGDGGFVRAGAGEDGGFAGGGEFGFADEEARHDVDVVEVARGSVHEAFGGIEGFHFAGAVGFEVAGVRSVDVGVGHGGVRGVDLVGFLPDEVGPGHDGYDGAGDDDAGHAGSFGGRFEDAERACHGGLDRETYIGSLFVVGGFCYRRGCVDDVLDVPDGGIVGAGSEDVGNDSESEGGAGVEVLDRVRGEDQVRLGLRADGGPDVVA